MQAEPLEWLYSIWNRASLHTTRLTEDKATKQTFVTSRVPRP
jgi:hypothetical protein